MECFTARQPIRTTPVIAPHAETATFGSDDLPDEIIVQILDIHRRVTTFETHLFGVASCSSGARPAVTLRHTSEASAYITGAWHTVTHALTARPSPEDSTELVALLGRMRTLESLIDRYWAARHECAQAVAIDAIGNLHRCRTSDLLIRRIPVEVSRLGFDRVLFSSVDCGTWTPQSAHCPTDPAWGTAYLDKTSDSYNLPRAAARLHPAQVEDRDMLRCRPNDRTFDLWRRSRSKRFWMVPLTERGRLTGLLHVDCLDYGNEPSRPQFAALRTLCTAVPAIVSYSLQRSPRVDVTTAGSPADQVHRAQLPHPCLPGVSTSSVLSTREVDVITLMASGLTNAQIGERLVITESTVKSHVKRIMKKTGSANRAGAVATWMNVTRDSAA